MKQIFTKLITLLIALIMSISLMAGDITDVSPNIIPISGGTLITITGTNLHDGYGDIEMVSLKGIIVASIDDAGDDGAGNDWIQVTSSSAVTGGVGDVVVTSRTLDPTTKVNGITYEMDYSGGSGTSFDPYKISNKANLLELCTTSADWNKHFKQTANIIFVDADFESTGDFYNGGAGFSPIGNATTKFTGSYNGEGHCIDGITVNRTGIAEQALFGYTSGATISFLGVTNVDITAGNY